MKNKFVIDFIYLIFQILGIFVISFILLHLVPGDPVLVMLGESSSVADRVALKQLLGLDQPLYTQLLQSLFGIFQGNFGTSIFNQQPVKVLIQEAIKNTYILAISSLLITLSVGSQRLLWRLGAVWPELWPQLPAPEPVAAHG